jgi:uncharacterized membrane protein YhaH (DUF805 family)
LWCIPSLLLGLILKYHLGSPWDGIIAGLYLLSLLLALPAAVRRSHDLGHSGWFALISLIPFAGWYLVFKRRDSEANKFEPSPVVQA